MDDRQATVWPVKIRELHNHHMNSTVWNEFKFRRDDIVVATYAKSGTTWTQQILAQLIFNGAEDVNVSDLSPWLDYRLLPREVIEKLATTPHRRFLKTHLPIDALVFSPQAKYLYIGRDGRDAVWSFFNHYANLTGERREAMNTAPGLVGPPLPPCPASPIEFYRSWFADNGRPIWPFWENVRSWWAIRHLPNVKLIHFNDLKADLPAMIRTIARFLEVTIDEARFAAIVEHCTFDYMKAHAERMAPRGGSSWKGGARTFINKGTNGRWRDTLSAEEVVAYEAKAVAELGEDCARWLAHGGAIA
ncbi:MAG: sulfotransferase domain-containing protein [Rhizobiales bacterium]|nr:sulfotransferase domain-containing protein [Hyphomicrobiales bacterium]MBI3674533.1 sulfotransferase domain-containing protein [Hyphomicrobiales bacterium]